MEKAEENEEIVVERKDGSEKMNVEKKNDENLICVATCGMCGFKEGLKGNDIEELAVSAFKHNPEARGSDLEGAYNFSRGPTCKGTKENPLPDKDYHVSTFNREWIEAVDSMAINVVSRRDKVIRLRKDIENKKSTRIELRKQIDAIDKSILSERAEETEAECSIVSMEPVFKRYTGTNRYDLFLKPDEKN